MWTCVQISGNLFRVALKTINHILGYRSQFEEQLVHLLSWRDDIIAAAAAAISPTVRLMKFVRDERSKQASSLLVASNWQLITF